MSREQQEQAVVDLRMTASSKATRPEASRMAERAWRADRFAPQQTTTMAQSRVCILPKGDLKPTTRRGPLHLAQLLPGLESDAPNTFLRLPHPRLGTPALFLLAQDKLYEVQAVTPDIKGNRSWFVGDSIVQGSYLPLDALQR
jgi:hypothetical protein